MNNSSITINFGTKNLLKLVLAIQFAVFGLIGLDFLGIKIPILRQAICFIYLSFIPGILILRILKLHKLGNIETLLYSVGLSLSFLMFTGALINSLYPLIGILKPISEIPLVITIAVIVLLLCFICYLHDKDYSTSFSINTEQIFSPPVLSLLLLPFLAVFGTYLLNFYDNNILLLILLAIISIIVVFVAFDKLPKEMYSLAVWVISISLLFHNSLISNYILGGDTPIEYYLSNLVILGGFWDSTFLQVINAMLGVVMLAPIFSIVCQIDLTWVFKVIYPILYSLVPLGLYHLFKRQTNEKIAFFSSFFFMSCAIFYTFMLGLAKQMTAEFFVMLLMLLIINKEMNFLRNSLLSIIFLFSLVTSHYGTSYIFLFAFIVLLLISFLERYQGNEVKNKVSPTFVILFLTFALSWYIYMADSKIFNIFTNIGAHTYESILEVLRQPTSAFIFEFILRPYFGLSLRILSILYLLTILFIAIGILTEILTKKYNFQREFFNLSKILFILASFVIAIPLLSRTAAPDRFYHITLLLLSPFCVIGGIEVIRKIAILIKKKSKKDQAIKIFSVFLIIFLLFNAGFVSEVIIRDFPGSSILIAKERITTSGTIEEKFHFYSFYIPDYDFYSTTWLSEYNDNEKRIFADKSVEWTTLLPYGMFGTLRCIGTWSNTYLLDNTSKIENAYIYLRYFNIINKVIIVEQLPLTFFYIDELKLEKKNKIYTNGGSEIYYR